MLCYWSDSKATERTALPLVGGWNLRANSAAIGRWAELRRTPRCHWSEGGSLHSTEVHLWG